MALREKCPNKEFFSGPHFPVFSPNTGKYGPEKTPYLDTFHAVIRQSLPSSSLTFIRYRNLDKATTFNPFLVVVLGDFNAKSCNW